MTDIAIKRRFFKIKKTVKNMIILYISAKCRAEAD